VAGTQRGGAVDALDDLADLAGAQGSSLAPRCGADDPTQSAADLADPSVRTEPARTMATTKRDICCRRSSTDEGRRRAHRVDGTCRGRRAACKATLIMLLANRDDDAAAMIELRRLVLSGHGGVRLLRAYRRRSDGSENLTVMAIHSRTTRPPLNRNGAVDGAGKRSLEGLNLRSVRRAEKVPDTASTLPIDLPHSKEPRTGLGIEVLYRERYELYTSTTLTSVHRYSKKSPPVR
jgi:hypothetical protein